MLAAGSVDIVTDPGLKPYDIVALIPIIEKAGGIVTTSTAVRPRMAATSSPPPRRNCTRLRWLR
jgi:fructose-1,6-bisphosphatase/inositol monophosphatase family enzyme